MMSHHQFELEKLYYHLGLYPQNSETYYKRAITHSSLNGQLNKNYEQLEFLGDAVLSMIVAEYLFQKYPLKNEGELSKMRSFIVSRAQLNAVAKDLNLSQFTLHNIDKKYIGNARDICGDIVEALIGAYYMDAGMDTAKAFVYKWILTEKILDKAQQKTIDPKSKLHEWAQKKKRKLEFRLLQPNLQNPNSFEVQVWMDNKLYGSGIGYNKKTAEKEAAIMTLNILDPNAGQDNID
ncbi:MAG: ribonuclease III [Chitinophagales bacterium]|nr:ribonuclease III [Chitinophagales bacterium]MCZ2393989.1 ribonuclease III [Chitinophagales bacterium]